MAGWAAELFGAVVPKEDDQGRLARILAGASIGAGIGYGARKLIKPKSHIIPRKDLKRLGIDVFKTDNIKLDKIKFDKFDFNKN